MGFTAGSVLQGIAVGLLLVTATLVSAEFYANPLVIPFQAMFLVGLTVMGMVMYLLTGPKNLSIIAGAVSTMFLPMIGLMVLTVVYPLNGIMGVLVSGVFVLISAAGLLVNMNQVMHKFSVNMPLAASFHISVGIVVLFWNVVVLIMSLRR